MKTKILAQVLVLTVVGFAFTQSVGDIRILLNEYDIVYVNTGEKVFHLEKCKNLSSSRTGMSLKLALEREYTPCPLCIPVKVKKVDKKVPSEEEKPVIKTTSATEKKPKKRSNVIIFVIAGVVVIGGIVIALLLGKKKSGEETTPSGPTSENIEWVRISEGSFKMGDNFNEGDLDEIPFHTVHLDTYYISKYEVTFSQYDEFCNATGRSKPGDEGWGRGARPVINVSWDDAKAFCDWLSSKTGENIHLPTEAQWEKASRGTDMRRYPWGDSSPTSSLANYKNSVGKTMPVGSYPSGVSPYGIHDMAGNVWEYCSDWYDSNYYRISPGSNPQGPLSGTLRVVHGGSWINYKGDLRCAARSQIFPTSRGNSMGFRLCKEMR